MRENAGIFVIHKHHARSLHYDLRLEFDGVLKSWAVPRGPSLDPAVRRLAIEVEDHPLDYADFEGVIAEGSYGAGEVIVWDRGCWHWSPSDETAARFGTPAAALAGGKLDVELEGEKLSGRFVLVRARSSRAGDRAWMLIKARDSHARPGSDVTFERSESVGSGRRSLGTKRSPAWDALEPPVSPKNEAP